MAEFNHSNFPQFADEAALGTYGVAPKANDLVQLANGTIWYFDESDTTSADIAGAIVTQTSNVGDGRWKLLVGGLKALYSETVNGDATSGSSVLSQGTIKGFTQATANAVLLSDNTVVSVTNLKVLAEAGILILNQAITADNEIYIVATNQAGADVDLSTIPVELEVKVFA